MQRRQFTLTGAGALGALLLLATTQARALTLPGLSNADASSGVKAALEQGALAAVALLGQSGGRIACASGADRAKVELQLRKVALMPFFEGRVFSGQEVARTKPAPDVYLAAAAALGAAPERCAVIEDSVTGVRSGIDAGATVFGYAPGGSGHSSAEALLAAGAVQVFGDMAELPALLAA